MTFSNKEILQLGFYYDINNLKVSHLDNAVDFGEAKICDTIIDNRGREVILTSCPNGKYLIMKRAPQVIDGSVLATVTVKDVYGRITL